MEQKPSLTVTGKQTADRDGVGKRSFPLETLEVLISSQVSENCDLEELYLITTF